MIYHMEGENGSDLNQDCWNIEISLRLRKHGEHNARAFQHNLLALDIDHLNFVDARQEALCKTPYYCRWVSSPGSLVHGYREMYGIRPSCV